MAILKENVTVYNSSLIQKRIFAIRNEQVMVDSDLADLYRIKTKVLNQAVKRNIERFPNEFMFQLTKEEKDELVTNCDHLGHLKFSPSLPYAFTEQGVAMLSAVLKSETAVKMSIQIMSAFVAMRKFLINNALLFRKIETVEKRQLTYQIETDQKFERVFNALQGKNLEPKQGIFFDGQIFDAHKFVSGIIRKAEKEIILIDNYIDETILDLFTKKKNDVKVTILTKNISKAIKLDEKKFNSQYQAVTIKEFNKAHDRFIIVDGTDVYHFGASLKDLGKKWFAFQKLDKTALSLMANLKKVVVEE